MDRANYTDNGKGRYPLSTDGLEFIQSQIELIYNVAELHGRNYILKGSTAMTEGIIVVDGEMMPLEGSPLNYIQVTEEYDKLEADGLVFEKARVKRVAQYIASSTGEGCYAASLFKKLTTIEEMTPHLMPKGAIVMWSGATNAIPEGWALCDGTNGTPNLSGRFIVGVGKADYKEAKTTYQLNTTGGEEEVKLSAAESGLPEHTHSLTSNYLSFDENYKGSVDYRNSGAKKGYIINSDGIDKCIAKGASEAHNNIPPYYVLAYIMKIV